ncbi:hypothetical protein ETD86_01675 [Nonomuraea turkmeniaca]|uniref:Secreted protein n=1 Tax=Nonomuraea turkmeniaca TaxID=103838 RepID=A0A5S4FX35_9ACTN|nr:hypothetical protein [Nonomuraea turkmeniaca]TMR25325.1 hypothetical protein ETD86_01675 [Nonomuraea turkmeniaca]
MIRRLLCLVVVLVLLCAAPAAAHNVSAGADLRIAQTIAGMEVTVVVKGTTRVPGPLRIGVIAFEPVTGPPVELAVRSVEDGRTVTGVARPVLRDPQYTELRVERTGPHELTLRAGNEVAVVPFRVLVERGTGAELLIYGGFFVAGLLLVGGLLTGAVARPGRAMAVSGGAAVGVTVAVMAIVFEPMLPAGPPDGAAPVVTSQAGGRPFVQGRVETVPARPAVGQEFTVRVDLVDGSTGRPVDDLAIHHEALAHVVVTSEDGRFFRHLHPLRTAAGRLEVRLRADRPGAYRTHVELEREDSGGQLLTGRFRIDGEVDMGSPEGGAEPAGAAFGAGDAEPAAPPRMRPAAPVAGRPATVELDATGPVRPWLGMSGHLIVRSQDGDFLGHVHEMGSGGPRLRFTFSFPEPGRYLAWAQYALADRIVTVPFTVDVSETVQ